MAYVPVYEDAVCVKTGLHPVSCVECLACEVVHWPVRSCSRCTLVYRGIVLGCKDDNCPVRK